MTPLDRQLAERIARGGPITVADWMQTALLDPQHGYYATRDPLGRDFITAPEISQMFGEIIGLWFADLWLRTGSPDAVLLVELGPGRGTLMADMLRTLARLPGARPAVQPHLVEVSATLEAIQRQTLAQAGEDTSPIWHRTLDSVPEDRPLFLVANELFDALPIRQWVRREDGWHERLLGLGPAGLIFTDGPREERPALAGRTGLAAARASEGAVAEVSGQGIALAAAIAGRIERQGGGALLIDYGYWEPPFGDTLQAMRRHRPHPPLQDCGEADLTAYVDFAALATAARTAAPQVGVWGPVEQGLFLRRNGIEARAQQLAPRDPAVPAALARLIRADQMGTLFKVLGITGPQITLPGGFDAGDRRP